jgi:inward rectifier potassium channel
MSVKERINPFSKTIMTPGFGTNVNSYGGRFINRDGSYNLQKEGVSFWNRFSLFHSMLNMPLRKFITVIILFFLGINLLYTIIYVLIGVEGFQGIIATSRWQQYKELYFLVQKLLRR